MRNLKRILACGLLCCIAPVVSAAPAKRVDAARLQDQVERLARLTNGQVGMAAMRVGGSRTLSLNGEAFFPTASTFKIAVEGRVLERVQQGELRLDQLVDVPAGMVVDSDGIAAFLPHPGVSLSLLNLLELMLTRSDNTATDVMVVQAGGPAAVTAWLRRAGIVKQRVDSDTANLIYRALDITPGPGTFAQNVERGYARDPMTRKRDKEGIPNPVFDRDPRDTTTPTAMLKLLVAIKQGKVLDPERTGLLLDIMARCRTGEKRLKSLLPADTPVAHKTGSLFGIANDVGLIQLPDGGTLAIAVFVKGDTKDTDAQERAIAVISRTAYDYFLTQGG